MMRELTINDKFKSCIRPLKPEEYDRLEKSIIEEGCRDAIMVWTKYLTPEEIDATMYPGICKEYGCYYNYHTDEGADGVPPEKWVIGDGVWRCPECGYNIAAWETKKTIIDGHNRYEICKKHNIEFDIKEIEFENDFEAKEWIYHNQLARRNLTGTEIDYLIAMEYEASKNKHGGDRKSESKANNLPLINTADAIAKEHNLSHQTVKNNVNLADSIDKINEAVPGARDELLSETVKMTKQDTNAVATLDPEVRKAIYNEYKDQEVSRLSELNKKLQQQVKSMERRVNNRIDVKDTDDYRKLLLQLGDKQNMINQLNTVINKHKEETDYKKKLIEEKNAALAELEKSISDKRKMLEGYDTTLKAVGSIVYDIKMAKEYFQQNVISATMVNNIADKETLRNELITFIPVIENWIDVAKKMFNI